MLYDGYTPKLWITLTEKNGTCRIKGMERVSKFLRELSFTTKSHLLIFRAGDYGYNFHEHIIVLVPNTETDRFDERLPRFRPSARWSHRHLNFQKWDTSYGNGAFIYQDNHINWRSGGKILPAFEPSVICPKVFRRCRNNKCEHSNHGIRRTVNHKP